MTTTTKRTFTALDGTGASYVWKYWRDGGRWFLADPEGYVRTLAATWTDSVPRIRLILANHDQTTPVVLEVLR
jgi:hypothetical protein